MAEHEYVLIIRSDGDGSTDYGFRFHSIRFRTREAAENAKEWLKEIKGDYASATVIED